MVDELLPEVISLPKTREKKEDIDLLLPNVPSTPDFKTVTKGMKPQEKKRFFDEVGTPSTGSVLNLIGGPGAGLVVSAFERHARKNKKIRDVLDDPAQRDFREQ